jgi:hypothetical protein
MGTLRLSDVRKKLPFRISKGMSTESLRWIVDNHYNDVWDFDVFLPSLGVNLQRPLVWTGVQKNELVLSVLKGIRIPSICYIQYKARVGGVNALDNSCTYKIIDGKQRLCALIDFVNGDYPLVVGGELYWYRDLDEKARYEIDSFTFSADVAYEYDYDMIPDADKVAWFEQINFYGTPQDGEHMKELKRRVEEVKH